MMLRIRTLAASDRLGLPVGQAAGILEDADASAILERTLPLTITFSPPSRRT